MRVEVLLFPSHRAIKSAIFESREVVIRDVNCQLLVPRQNLYMWGSQKKGRTRDYIVMTEDTVIAVRTLLKRFHVI
jgi:hypothetical protein